MSVLKTFKPSVKELVPYIKSAVDNGKKVRITVTGYSMYPLLRGGSDDVFLTSPDNLKKYDVIFFKRENGDYVFHRIIKIKDGYFILAGDNETKKEYPVYPDSVVAKMEKFERFGKLHETSEISYKIYSRLWLFIFPLRHFFVKIIVHFGIPFKKIFVRRKNEKNK